MKNEILTHIDFSSLIENIKEIFKNCPTIFDVIEDDLIRLCDDNFTCYKSNMLIIESRKISDIDYQSISYFENISRTVGESRCKCKSNINKKIHNIYTNNPISEPEDWMSDDIVYSVGEMLDRISIEFIKQNHFEHQEDYYKIEISRKWENRVKKYLTQKLDEIIKKQSYEIAEETRTYKV